MIPIGNKSFNPGLVSIYVPVPPAVVFLLDNNDEDLLDNDGEQLTDNS